MVPYRNGGRKGCLRSQLMQGAQIRVMGTVAFQGYMPVDLSCSSCMLT